MGNTAMPPLALRELAARYFELKAVSKRAFRANHGAVSTGAALRASLLANRFQRDAGAKSSDAAVAMMRDMRDRGHLGYLSDLG